MLYVKLATHNAIFALSQRHVMPKVRRGIKALLA